MTRATNIGLLALLLLVVQGMSHAQGADPGPTPTVGTEYYVTFLPSDNGAGAKFLGLLVSAQTATRVDVSIPNGDGTETVKGYDVMPDQIVTIPIPASVIPPYLEEVARLGVHVTSRAPIALYAINDRYQSVGATPVVPVNRWGLSYLPTTLPNAFGSMTGTLSIVAAYDSTVVTIVPSTKILFQDAGRERTITLNRGDVFLIKAAEGNPGSADLSGTEIVSWSRPVGVVSGHVRTSINADGSVSESNWSSHVMTMLLPDSSWGSLYYTTPMRSGQGDRYRLTSARNGTVVTATHFVPGGNAESAEYVINRGEIVDVTTISGREITGAVRWQGTDAISVAQLRLSGPYGSPANAPAFVFSAGTNEFASRTVFAAPTEIGGDQFPATGHALTVLVLGTGGETEASILSSLTLDKRPFAQAVTGATVQRIGGDNVFVVRGDVLPGGHTLTAADGHRFLARLVGTGDVTGRDFYAMTLPFWLPQSETDNQPPYLVTAWRDATQANVYNARISDNRDPDYFSGVWSVRVVNSPGWEMLGTFTPPNPDDEATVRFRATTDPSGPLFAELRDRDANTAIVQISDGICIRTANVDRADISINVPANELPRTERVLLSANTCGDVAHVESATLGVGSANTYVSLGFVGRVAPFAIDAHAADTVELTVKTGTPEGLYSTSIVLRVDGFTFTLPVTITVGPPSSAPITGPNRTTLSAIVYPNPITSSATIVMGRPLGRDATLRIVDPLGRTVKSLHGDDLAGRSSLLWDGRDAGGSYVTNGAYLVAVDDGAEHVVRTISIVR